MEQIMLRLCECKCMPIAGFAASTFRIDFTPRRSYLPSSNFSCQFKYKAFSQISKHYYKFLMYHLQSQACFFFIGICVDKLMANPSGYVALS